MFDVILQNAGAQMILASSSDEDCPPENIIDGNSETFWATTGMFPQEFVIKFSAAVALNRVSISCYNVKKLVVETTDLELPEKFEVVAEKVLESTDQQLQEEEFMLNGKSAQCIRFVIESGYDHFVSVHSVHSQGQARHG